jgi:dienelactone hydrolase
MQTREIRYEHDGVTMHGSAVIPEGSGPRPGVLVAHDWSGKNALALKNAERLAKLGYVGFALDMYGEGRTGGSMEENTKLMGPLREDRGVLMGRIGAALGAMKALDEVDAGKTGAIGFCFGGLCVLDLARSGAEVGGVVSFHGLLDAPPAELCESITAKVLVLHGYLDPMVKPDAMLAFCKEMEAAGIDWQLHAYGTAVHAFTNPGAQAAGMAAFEQEANDRSFRSMADFFGDLFG